MKCNPCTDLADNDADDWYARSDTDKENENDVGDPDGAKYENAGTDNVDDDNDDDEKSEDDSLNSDDNGDNIKNYPINGDTDADGFGTDNTRANNVGADKSDDDINAADTNAADAGSNENGDPDDTDAQHEPSLLSGVFHSCLALVMFVGYVHLKPWHW